MELAGELILNETTRLPFSNSYVAPLAGATRVARIAASDELGYSYELLGSFTNLRLASALRRRLGRPATLDDSKALPAELEGEIIDGELYVQPRPRRDMRASKR